MVQGAVDAQCRNLGRLPAPIDVVLGQLTHALAYWCLGMVYDLHYESKRNTTRGDQVVEGSRNHTYDPEKALPRKVIEKMLSEAASQGKKEMG